MSNLQPLTASRSIDFITATLAVGAGGIAGSLARYACTEVVNRLASDQFPLATLLINLLGSFILALFLTAATYRRTPSPTLQLIVATGVLGSFTTFSTLSFEVATHVRDGDSATALLYLGSSLLGGLVLTYAGFLLGRRLASPVHPHVVEENPTSSAG